MEQENRFIKDYMAEDVPLEDFQNHINSLDDTTFAQQYPLDETDLWIVHPNPENRPDLELLNQKIRIVNGRQRALGILKDNYIPEHASSNAGTDRTAASKDPFPGPYTRNFDGKIVDTQTNEPVREGSPQWQELRKKGIL